MAQGPTVYNAMIMVLSSSSAPPRPHPGPTPPPGGGGQPPYPDHTLPGDLPRPEHPIWYPLPPGAPVDPEYGIPEDGPYPDQGLPGDQPHPDHTLPGDQPHPDQGLPGSQPRPDQGLPGPQPHPEHPIVLPPDSGGWEPVFIWGPGDPRPTVPIVIPEPIPPEGNRPAIEFKPIWTPVTGWVVIGIPTGPHPVPSAKK